MSHEQTLWFMAIAFLAVWAMVTTNLLGEGLSEVKRRRTARGGPHFLHGSKNRGRQPKAAQTTR